MLLCSEPTCPKKVHCRASGTTFLGALCTFPLKAQLFPQTLQGPDPKTCKFWAFPILEESAIFILLILFPSKPLSLSLFHLQDSQNSW